jgi:hypothetical protein
MNISPFRNFRHLLAAIFFALLVTALWVTPAFADGETPPPPDTGTTEVADGGIAAEATPAPTELATTEELVSTEVVPTDEAIQPTEPAPAETVTDAAPAEVETSESPATEGEITGGDLLAELPEGTDVVVLDAEGESVPLASEEAAEIIAGGDPIWCPVGVTPISGAGGCSPTTLGFSGPEGLLDWISLNDPAQAGVIWVEESYFASSIDGFVQIDGSAFTNIPNYALTIKGGWTGAGTTIDQNNPSQFDEGFSIINWVGSITISDILIDGADNVSTEDQAGLKVVTNGSIVLNRVQSNNTTNTWAGVSHGAQLDNTGGTGNVTVTNSSFGNNDGRGLNVLSKGSITLKNVMVYDNGNVSNRYGAYLENETAWTPKPVTVTSSTFSNNGSNGLNIFSDGTVTLSYITASLNTFDGAHIETPGAVTLSGVNNFSGNGEDGLDVDNDGTITVAKTTANNNAGFGILLDNSGAATPKNVLLTGFAIAGGNSSDGIAIHTQGTVTAANLTAHNNGGYGVYINNADYDLATHSVLITGTNYFHNNASDGLYVKTTGAVTMYNVTAIYNDRGVYVDNRDSATPLPVAIKGTNLFQDNTRSGVFILSNGTVILNNISALDNGANGIYVQNTYWGKPYAVSVTGTNRIQGNDETGVEIYSRGAITLNNMTVTGNGATTDGYGALLYNWYTSTVQQPVYVKGYNTFSDNAYDGLHILSYGAVSLSNITAINNGQNMDDGNGQGVEVHNTGGIYAKGVTLTGVNMFNYNDGNGLYVVSDGAISVSKPTAYYNGYNGLHLDNTGPFQANVTISGFGQFSWNGNEGGGGTNEQDGLSITTHGTVTLANITATYNYGGGASVDTIGFNAPHAVTLSGTNTFNYNGNTGEESGLVINADGNITISNLTADYNYYRGADLDNYTNWFTNPGRTTATPLVPFTSFGSIFLNGFANFEGNITADGVFGLTHGSITTTRVTASDNGDGAGESGINLTADGNITMTCTVAYGNDFRNLDLNAGGSLTLKGLLSFGGISGIDLLTYGTTFTQTTCP